MTPPLISLRALEIAPRPPEHLARDPATAARFDCSQVRFGKVLGLHKLGVNVTAVKPGKAAYPVRPHPANSLGRTVIDNIAHA